MWGDCQLVHSWSDQGGASRRCTTHTLPPAPLCEEIEVPHTVPPPVILRVLCFCFTLHLFSLLFLGGFKQRAGLVYWSQLSHLLCDLDRAYHLLLLEVPHLSDRDETLAHLLRSTWGYMKWLVPTGKAQWMSATAAVYLVPPLGSCTTDYIGWLLNPCGLSVHARRTIIGPLQSWKALVG